MTPLRTQSPTAITPPSLSTPLIPPVTQVTRLAFPMQHSRQSLPTHSAVTPSITSTSSRSLQPTRHSPPSLPLHPKPNNHLHHPAPTSQSPSIHFPPPITTGHSQQSLPTSCTPVSSPCYLLVTPHPSLHVPAPPPCHSAIRQSTPAGSPPFGLSELHSAAVMSSLTIRFAELELCRRVVPHLP